MGMKLRCFEGSGGQNSYCLLENVGENKDSSTEKQEQLQFFNDDGSYTNIVVEKDLRSIDLCMLLAVKNRVAKDYSWSIVEHWVETGIERVLEDHEDILAVHRQTESGAKKYIFRRLQNKYDFFTEPESFFPADMVDLRNSDEAVSACSSEDLAAPLEQLLNSEECPSIFSQVCMQTHLNRNTWVKTFLLLKENKLFMSSKVHVVAKFLRHWKSRDNCYRTLDEQDPNKLSQDDNSHQELQVLADLKEYEVYTCLNAKNQLKAPTEFGICLRKKSEEDFSSSIILSCECQRDRTCWVTAMRLAKYGKQLRENYRAYKEKQEQLSAREYSSYTVPNESVRSRVAMDFTGSVGRIVEDPTEAEAIAISEGIAWRRRGRPPHFARRAYRSSDMVHVSQPWFHRTMTREQAAALVSAHGNLDGVFLVRESQSNPGVFVLTFKCSNKVIHMPITPITDPVRDAVCFTLDNGVTKFYDLLQLIEFYQLNAGCLPARLTHYLERSSQRTPYLTDK